MVAHPKDAPETRLDRAENDADDLPGLDAHDDPTSGPGDDETLDGRIQFVRTGLTRVWVRGELFRLRRPFFGEFKKMRLALEDLVDEISELAQSSMAVSRQVAAEREALGASPEPELLASSETEWRKRQREAQRNVTDRADALRLEWWVLVFDTISLDGKPKKSEWPAWVTDPSVAVEFIAHWRSAPQGRG